MEDNRTRNDKEPESFQKRIIGAFIAGIHFVGNQLRNADLNPHEGKLRGSAIPGKYIEIPDFPPVDNNPK